MAGTMSIEHRMEPTGKRLIRDGGCTTRQRRRIGAVEKTVPSLVSRVYRFSSFLSIWLLLAVACAADAYGDFVSIYRGGICVSDAGGNCIGSDIVAEAGIGAQVGYMKTTADAGTVPVYQSTCYSNTSGTCTAWGLSLIGNGTAIGYLSTTPPDTASANNPLTQNNGLLLQNLGGAPSAYLWSGGGGSNPTKLVVTSVNGGNNPTAGVGFSVVVQAQDASGAPGNVTANTGVSLSLKIGTGTLGGTLSGTISAGTNQVTIGGVTYTKAEGGIVLTASRTSGDPLNAGDSTGFAVNPAAAAKVAFTTQPGNSILGSAITGPPTVSVQDTFGNTVTTSTASITLAIAANPGGGVLSGTTTRNASSGTAVFTGLSINQAGTGYSLSATSSGLATPLAARS